MRGPHLGRADPLGFWVTGVQDSGPAGGSPVPGAGKPTRPEGDGLQRVRASGQTGVGACQGGWAAGPFLEVWEQAWRGRVSRAGRVLVRRVSCRGQASVAGAWLIGGSVPVSGCIAVTLCHGEGVASVWDSVRLIISPPGGGVALRDLEAWSPTPAQPKFRSPVLPSSSYPRGPGGDA